MAINPEAQFEKLCSLIEKGIDSFHFSREDFFGPVAPTSIITFGSDIIRINALVLAEAVPTFQLPVKFGQNLYEAVIVHLDENFEFTAYDPAERSLSELNVLIGDPEYSYDGTVDQAKGYFEQKKWFFDIIHPKKEEDN